MPPTSSHIATAARGWIGTPYRHQASLKGVGADCLGLMRGVWREIYGGEPETVPAYSAGLGRGRRHRSPCRRGAPQPGGNSVYGVS